MIIRRLSLKHQVSASLHLFLHYIFLWKKWIHAFCHRLCDFVWQIILLKHDRKKNEAVNCRFQTTEYLQGRDQRELPASFNKSYMYDSGWKIKGWYSLPSFLNTVISIHFLWLFVTKWMMMTMILEVSGRRRSLHPDLKLMRWDEASFSAQWSRDKLVAQEVTHSSLYFIFSLSLFQNREEEQGDQINWCIRILSIMLTYKQVNLSSSWNEAAVKMVTGSKESRNQFLRKSLWEGMKDKRSWTTSCYKCITLFLEAL